MEILQKYLAVRSESVEMCSHLAIEDYIPQPVAFVSPPKWNLGHTTWFFEQIILSKYQKNFKVYHPKYAYLFNSYYQALGDRVKRSSRGDLSRPTVDEVYAYRQYVDNQMVDLIKEESLSKEFVELVTIGINHEQQHQELFFADLKYTFSLNPLLPQYSARVFCEEGNASAKGFLNIDEGVYNIGYHGNGFAYDNELPHHKTYIHSFEIAKSLVSNSEYLEFVECGGYNKPDFWHDDAWTWLKENNIEHPMYWKKINSEWFQYTLAGMKLLNVKSPVTHISYYEAYAFAQWKGMRLPTEFEWEVASEHIHWGDRWEWTESSYLPYPGYKKLPGALGEYNGKFMVNQKVLRGASIVTPKGHERNTYRNFFHPHIAYQFNGIRLAK